MEGCGQGPPAGQALTCHWLSRVPVEALDHGVPAPDQALVQAQLGYLLSCPRAYFLTGKQGEHCDHLCGWVPWMKWLKWHILTRPEAMIATIREGHPGISSPEQLPQGRERPRVGGRRSRLVSCRRKCDQRWYTSPSLISMVMRRGLAISDSYGPQGIGGLCSLRKLASVLAEWPLRGSSGGNSDIDG